MTTIYFVRHGETTYQYVDERGFIGQGRDLAQLTKAGISQLKQTSKDCRLIDSEFIVSSPYTRALQSASILSKELSLDIEIEIDLHEWLPDKTFQFKTTRDALDLCNDFEINNGIYPIGEDKRWETEKSMKYRMESVIKKYLKYNKVIMVCHSMVIEALTGVNPEYGGIIEYCISENTE